MSTPRERRSHYVDVVRCTCGVATGGHRVPNPGCQYHSGKAASQTRMVDPLIQRGREDAADA